MYPTQLTGAERQAVAIAHILYLFVVVISVIRNGSKREIWKLLEWWEIEIEVIRIWSLNCCPLTYL